MKKSGRVICFITPSLKLGGLENAVYVMANYFFNKNYDVKVITVYKFDHFYKLNDAVEVIEPPFRKKGVPKIWYYIKIIFYLQTQLRRTSPEAVVSYGDYINSLVLLASVGLKIPVYISDRSSPGKKFPLLVNAMRKILYKKATGIIAQTERARIQKISMLGNEVHMKVIPNPIRKLGTYPEISRQDYVLAVGRHYHVKGLDRLIRAFSMIKNLNWKLIVAGSEGPETPNLKKLIEELGLRKQIELLGSVQEIDKIYAKSKVFVLPSRSEGFPNALIEAMANGLACISFDINAGPSDIINHGENGILVEDGNINDLASKMRFVIENEKERNRLGKNASQVKEYLSLEHIGRIYEEFIINNINCNLPKVS